MKTPTLLLSTIFSASICLPIIEGLADAQDNRSISELTLLGDSSIGPVENLYWPGDFEHRFEGGIFGSKRNLTMSTEANHTPGGKQSWKLAPGYQHLELLVPSFRKGVVRFRVLAGQPQTMIFKVVDPLPGVPVTKENPARTHDQTLEIPASSDWQTFEIPFETFNSWPKPPVSEILLTFYHTEGAPVFIDDLEVRMLPEEAPAKERAGKRADVLSDAAAIDAITFGPQSPQTNFAHYPLNADQLRGRTIRISADITYLSMDGDFDPWGSMLLSVARGNDGNGDIIEPDGAWPLWLPMGQAAPIGTAKRISRTFQIPADAGALSLRMQAQSGMGKNSARVSGVNIEVLD
jgi:hypothetical protein